jgi:hypothetical protein
MRAIIHSARFRLFETFLIGHRRSYLLFCLLVFLVALLVRGTWDPRCGHNCDLAPWASVTRYGASVFGFR